jgi:hypothetical protein
MFSGKLEWSMVPIGRTKSDVVLDVDVLENRRARPDRVASSRFV